jgi:hypothetical protein
MPARSALFGFRPQRRPVPNRLPIHCDPPYNHVCGGCPTIIPRHRAYCGACDGERP